MVIATGIEGVVAGRLAPFVGGAADDADPGEDAVVAEAHLGHVLVVAAQHRRRPLLAAEIVARGHAQSRRAQAVVAADAPVDAEVLRGVGEVAHQAGVFVVLGQQPRRKIGDPGRPVALGDVVVAAAEQRLQEGGLVVDDGADTRTLGPVAHHPAGAETGGCRDAVLAVGPGDQPGLDPPEAAVGKEVGLIGIDDAVATPGAQTQAGPIFQAALGDGQRRYLDVKDIGEIGAAEHTVGGIVALVNRQQRKSGVAADADVEAARPRLGESSASAGGKCGGDGDGDCRQQNPFHRRRRPPRKKPQARNRKRDGSPLHAPYRNPHHGETCKPKPVGRGKAGSFVTRLQRSPHRCPPISPGRVLPRDLIERSGTGW